MHELKVFLTPELANGKVLKDSSCVVVDVLRATSSWVTALGNDAKFIRPITTLKECKHLGQKGFLTAAERGGQKVEGFDLGNSPFEYSSETVKGKKIAVTTTNGTRAVKYASAGKEVYFGAYLNIKALYRQLSEKENIAIICSGWEGKPSMEDILFAGELVGMLSSNHVITDDAAIIAFELSKKAKPNMYFFLSQAIHVKRLLKLGLKKDIEYCLKKDVYQVVPRLVKGDIVAR